MTNAPDYDVYYMNTISTNMAEFPKVLKIANSYDNVFSCVGVHPCHIKDHPLVTYDELYEQTKHSKVIGIGESGIDLFHDKTTLIYKKNLSEHTYLWPEIQACH